MKYEKPQIIDTFDAQEVIQGQDKISHDFDGVQSTSAAYEADE